MNTAATAAQQQRQRTTALWLELLTLGGFCAFLFFFGLGSFGLVGADEPRYAQIARQMLARRDWVTPVLNGAPWLEKPVLYYWGAMISYQIFGVSDWAARVPSAVFSTAMIVAAYCFLRRFRPGAQLDAGLIIASSVGILGFARAASTDMPLAATFTIAMLAWFAWLETGRRLWLAGFYAFLGLAALAKGPVAPFLAVLVILAFVAIRREWMVVARTLWWPGILIGCAVALPWYVLVQLHNPQFFRVFFVEHNLARYGTNMFRHKQPFWYFVPVILLGLLPWTVYAIAALVRAFADVLSRRRQRQPHGGFELFFACWAVLPVIFFSFSGSKLPGYVLPAMPAFGILLADYIRKRSRETGRDPLPLTLLHCAAGGVVLGAALLVEFFVPRIWPSAPALGTAATAAFLMLLLMLVTIRLGGFGIMRLATLVPVLLGLAFVIRVGAGVIDARLSARPIAREIAAVQMQRAPVAVFRAPREIEYGLNFYLNRPIANYERGEVPAVDHLVIARTGSGPDLQQATRRRVSRVGEDSQQKLEFFWVSLPHVHRNSQPPQ